MTSALFEVKIQLETKVRVTALISEKSIPFVNIE